MTEPCHTILVEEAAWKVGTVRDGEVCLGEVPFPAEAPWSDRVQVLHQHLQTVGYSGQSLMLGLPSSWLLCARFKVDPHERGPRRKVLAFGLEENLPVSAEQFVADYVEGPDGLVLGVCAELDRLTQIVEALESHGIRIQHVCPVALLAANYALSERPDAHVIVVHHQSSQPSSDLIEIADSRPVGWWWLADVDAALHQQSVMVKSAASDHQGLVTLGQSPRGDDHNADRTIQIDVQAAAAIAASRILAAGHVPWIDLRRDCLATPHVYEMYRGPARALIAATIILLASICGGAYWRGRQYQALTGQYVQQQAEILRSTLPGQRVPGNVKSRLSSERQKLAGLGGQEIKGAVPETTSALLHLRAMLSSLPHDVRYRILDVSVQPDFLRVEGQAMTHADAERISLGLRDAHPGEFEIEPPKTQALAGGGVSFVFHAKPQLRNGSAKGAVP